MRPILVRVTDAMRQEAERKSGHRYSAAGSIRGGDGRLVGALGELAVYSTLPGAKWTNTVDHDMVFGGRRIDVKTKERTVAALPHFNASLATANLTQDCDVYAFASVIQRGGRLVSAAFVGWLARDEFHASAFHLRAGDLEPGTDFVVRGDCLNVRFDALREPRELGGIESLCPACGGPFRFDAVGKTKLYVCENGCTGRRIASALGEPLPRTMEAAT